MEPHAYNEISLADIFSVYLKRKYLVLSLFIIGLITVLIVSRPWQQYTFSTVLYLPHYSNVKTDSGNIKTDSLFYSPISNTDLIKHINHVSNAAMGKEKDLIFSAKQTQDKIINSSTDKQSGVTNTASVNTIDKKSITLLIQSKNKKIDPASLFNTLLQKVSPYLNEQINLYTNSVNYSISNQEKQLAILQKEQTLVTQQIAFLQEQVNKLAASPTSTASTQSSYEAVMVKNNQLGNYNALVIALQNKQDSVSKNQASINNLQASIAAQKINLKNYKPAYLVPGFETKSNSLVLLGIAFMIALMLAVMVPPVVELASNLKAKKAI